ncbi:MAG: glycosyltransferase family 4 protein [Acidobacteria bacterium]|nr:glycosyltransferase family 4 protein [Acidobacteriota bacterium]
MQDQRPRLVHIIASPLGVKGVLRGQLGHMSRQGFDVHVITSPSDEIAEILAAEGVSFIPVPIEREISVGKDLQALWRLWRVLRRLRPDICQVGMPKAGLLGGLAAWFARVPYRIYTLHGLRLETLQGWKRTLLIVAERCACATAHRVICVGDGLRRQAIGLGLVRESDCTVLPTQSSNGLDARRFEAGPALRASAHGIRERLGIPQSATVIGFVGRLTRDKGIYELVQAFERLKQAYPEMHLLLVGPYEEGDPVARSTRIKIQIEPRIHLAGPIEDVAPYYHAMDMVALPSYREGLPMTVLKAGAAGKPVVGSTATGMADAVIHGQTGLLVPVGDIPSLSEAFTRLLDDPAYGLALGQAGHDHVVAQFQQEKLWADLTALYRSLLPHAQGTATTHDSPQTLAGSPTS